VVAVNHKGRLQTVSLELGEQRLPAGRRV